MKVNSYFLKYKARALQGHVYITYSDKDINDPLWNIEPYYLFDNDDLCVHYGVIGACNLCKKWLKSKSYWYINTPYVDSKLRGIGYGKLLYRLSIASAKYMTLNLKSKQYLAPHNAMESEFPLMSIDAQRIYDSLSKNKYIRKYKKIVNTVKSDDDTLTKMEFDSFHIDKFDNVDIQYIGDLHSNKKYKLFKIGVK